MNKLIGWTAGLWFLLSAFPGQARQGITADCPRQRISFDEGWRFRLGDGADPVADYGFSSLRLYAKSAENYVAVATNGLYDDSAWQKVDLPHDWVVALPFDSTDVGTAWSHGYRPAGGHYPQNSIGWYRKTFDLPSGWKPGQRVAITFDGIFRNSRVWVNGHYLGTHFSGYTGVSYDITDFIRTDASNLIVVRADITFGEGWFYEGGGIYRHTWLETFGDLHFTRHGIYATTDLPKGGSPAGIRVRAHLANTGEMDRDCSFRVLVCDREGREVAASRPHRLVVGSGEEQSGEVTLKIPNPKLWDVESPYLYRIVAEIRDGDALVDRQVLRYGIRHVEIDPDRGLVLNGRPLKIKGACCHQDHAGVGSALPDYLQYYRIRLLREMGANAYRTAHNPPTPELLDACDSLGMLVVDETRLLNSAPEYMAQWEELILRDRNRPSVFMWSVGNEEDLIQSGTTGRNFALSLMRRQRQLDPTRPATYGANNGKETAGVNEVIDVRGFNYYVDQADEYRRLRPDQPMCGLEVGSTVSTRGVFRTDSVRCYLADFDENHPAWSSTAEAWWRIAAVRDWFMGGFVWTGFDYRGEPTPFKWPNVNSHFGVMDMCGFPKSIYYYYQSWWTDRDVLHIAPHWNPIEGMNDIRRVWVNSNADSVGLFLNGRSLGCKAMPQNGHLVWEVAYQPGTLRAIAHKRGRTFETTIRTTGAPERIVLTPDKHKLSADGRDAVVVNVSVVDAAGQEVPDADGMIAFRLEGDARIIGVGNGDPSCHEPDQYPAGAAWKRSLFAGRCQVILQAGKGVSGVRLQASSAGLIPAEAVIEQR